ITLWFEQGQPDTGCSHSLFSTAALAASKQQLYQRVVDIAALAPPEVQSSELEYIRGTAVWHLGRGDEAIDHLVRATSDVSLRKPSGSDPSTATWRPLMALAYIYEATNRLPEAYQALRGALGHAPGRPDILFSLAAMAGKLADPQAGVDWAQQLLQLGDAAQQAQARELIATYASWQVQPKAGDLRISACLIVKNEEHNLPRILGSLRSAVDEVILVDTGSTDGTAALATSLGAQVHHFAWCDDFGAARNESLRHATGDWILWVDGDDELVEAAPGALRQLCSDAAPAVSGWLVPCHSLRSADGQVGSVIQQWRLFPNHRGLHFEGRIHESLTLPGAAAPQVLTQDQVLVRHWGYVPREGLVEEKGERNFRLLHQAVAEEPDNPYHEYNLSKQHVWQDQPADALVHARRAIALWAKQGRPNVPYLSPMFAIAVHCAVNTAAYQDALDLEAQLPAHALSSETLCEAAIACLNLGRHDEAIARLQRASTDSSVSQGIERDPATATWKPLLLLADVHLKLGRQRDAYDCIKRAMAFMPRLPAIVLEWARLAVACGEPREALPALRELIATGDDATKAKARQALLEIARQIQDPELLPEAETARDAPAVANPSSAYTMSPPAAQADATHSLPSIPTLAPTPAPDLSLTACLIVKDEEHNLPRCLASLAGEVDEMVVVDTGSADRTIEIARQFGAHVSSAPWENDFAAARNASLKEAHGAFVLWIDADEELIGQAPGALRQLCAALAPEHDGCWMPCDSLGSEAGDVRTSAQQWRLFRNAPGLAFEGRIHEQLRLPDGRAPRLAEQEAVRIRHWGYIATGDLQERKSRRNHELLALSAQERPRDPGVHFNLGLQCSAEGNFPEALEEMQRAIALWRGGAETGLPIAGMFAIAVLAAVRLGQLELAVALAVDVPDQLVSTDLLCYEGIAHWQLGHAAPAIERLSRAASDRTRIPAQLHDLSTSTWRPPYVLAEIYLQLGQPDIAQQQIERALSFDPHEPDVTALAGRVAQALERPAATLAARV
ncbi:MAG: glycosyltransferase, partial [Chloroflexota bacterium]